MKILTLDVETISDWTPPEGQHDKFPPISTHRPVVVSWMASDTSKKTQDVVTYDSEKTFEDAILMELAGFIKWAERLVTWNGRGFDMPLLKIRAMANGIDWRFWCSAAPGFNSVRRSRFVHWKDPTPWPFHVDLMDEIGDSAARPSLDDTAKALGLSGKTDVSGGDVGKLWRAGEVDAVRRYCEQDVHTTWEIYTRWAISNGCPAERFDVK